MGTVQEDTFKLQHLLDANLLSKGEDVEDLAAAAVKEKQIERKLDVLHGEWAVQDVRFMEHKSRGAVVIKPADYAELVEKLEESQMNLSSMATNRYSKPFEADVRLHYDAHWLHTSVAYAHQHTFTVAHRQGCIIMHFHCCLDHGCFSDARPLRCCVGG